jgi:hypothetical protein
MNLREQCGAITGSTEPCMSAKQLGGKEELPGIKFRMDGSTALITGAGGGIGEAIALAFADAGAQLILVARDVVES